MTYKHIEASREIRLWISTIIVPAAAMVVMAMKGEKLKDAIGGATQKIFRQNGDF